MLTTVSGDDPAQLQNYLHTGYTYCLSFALQVIIDFILTVHTKYYCLFIFSVKS